MNQSVKKNDAIEGSAEEKNTPSECFTIMPIAEVESYSPNHFRHVYENIIIPACTRAGFKASRADNVKAANLIQLDILKRLLDAPIAICDLSTRNPNVLFELGIRQAFDKPVVLIQEAGTLPIFDISPLRYLNYSRDMRYHEVLKTQQELADAIKETIDSSTDSGSVNSIVKLLGLREGAKIPDLKGDKEALEINFMRQEMTQLRKMIEVSIVRNGASSRGSNIIENEFARIGNALDRVEANTNASTTSRKERLEAIIGDLSGLVQHADLKADRNTINILEMRALRMLKKIVEDEEIPF